MKKVMGILTIVILACFILSPHAMAVSRSKVVIVATPEDPTTLDPGSAFDPKSELVIRNCYNTLLAMDGTSASKVKGELAENWKVSDKGLTYTFNLKKGIKFQDGTGLTADDVKYSVERTIKMGKSPASQLDIIKSVEAPGKYTVKFVLKHPVPWFLTLLAQSGSSVLNSNLVKSHSTAADPLGQNWLHDKAAGSGPYSLKSWAHEQQIVLDKNPHYFEGWKKSYFDEVIIRTIKEPSERRLLLEKGDVDIAYRISEDDIMKVEKNKDLKVLTQPSLTMFYIGLNTQRGPLKNVKVRQALAYAFDYNAFIKDTMRGLVNRMWGPVPTAIWKYDKSYPKYTHNIKKAKKLLAEAGYPNGGFTLNFVVETGGNIHKNAALVLQQSAKKLGIKIKIQFLSWTTIWAMMAKENEAPEIFDTHWYADYADPQDFLEFQYSSAMFGDKGFNESYYSNPKVDKLLSEAKFLPDKKRRKELYAQATRQIMKDCPAIWAAERLQIVPIRDWVKGYTLNPIYYEMPCFYGMHR